MQKRNKKKKFVNLIIKKKTEKMWKMWKKNLSAILWAFILKMGELKTIKFKWNFVFFNLFIVVDK